MKKNFFKKLSLGLALALVVGTTAQAGTAKAAETWALKQASKTLFMNKEDSTWDFNFKKLPKDWKKLYDFEWTTGNSKVATVAKGGVVTAVSVGETTVDCTVTEKDGGKVVATASSKVVVKANAAEVVITNVENGYVAYVGESIDLNRAMYDENGNKTTKRGVYVTDYTRWSAYTVLSEDEQVLVEDAEVVAIDQKTGTFTMKKAGTYALVAETYQSSKNPETTAADAIIVVVEDEFAVEQNKDNAELNQIDVVFAVPVAKDAFKAVEEVAVNVLESVGTETIERSIPVKSATATYDKDNTVVTGVKVTLWNKLENNKTYEVTYGTEKDQFVASVGAPAYIEIEVAKNGNIAAANDNVIFVETAGKVENNTLTVIYRDANGVNVTNVARNGEEEWILDEETGIVNFDQDNKTITASKDAAGKSYQLVIKYTEINNEGDPVVVAAGALDFFVNTVTDVVLNVKNAGVVKGATETPGYDEKRTPGTKVAVNDEGIYFAVSAIDAWGNKVGNTGSDVYDLRFELSDPSKGYIDESTGEFMPFQTGWVYVNVFYTDKTVENPKEQYLTTKSIYVQADRVPGKLAISDNKASASLTANVLKGETAQATNIEETATFYFTLADNYGESFYTNRTKADFTFKGVSDEVIEAIDVTYDADKKAYKLTVTNTELIPEITNKDNLKSTTVTVKITVGSAEDAEIDPITFSVSVKKPVDKAIASYKADVADINIAEKNSITGAVDLVVYGLNKNGVKVAKITSLDAYLIDGDVAAFTKANANGVVAAEQLFAGATSGSKLIYTITEGKNVIKATGEETATAATGAIIKVNGQVMEGFIDGIVLVDSINVDGIGDVTYHAQAGKYTVTVYQITKTTTDGKAEYKYAKKCADDFTVTNSLGKVAVAQDLTTTKVYTSVNTLGSKLTWTYDETIKNAVTECFTFKLGDTVVDADAKAFQVRVSANGKSVYVKSVKVFRSVGADEYVAYTVDVNKTINIGE